MNQTVAQIARHYVRGDKLAEPMLNRVEHGIRCYDPCLSCSTHASGRCRCTSSSWPPTAPCSTPSDGGEWRLARKGIGHGGLP